MKNIKKGDYVLLDFLDHVETDGDSSTIPLACRVVGRLLYKGKTLKTPGANKSHKYVVVESWFYPPDVPTDTARTNTKTYTILVSAVLSCVRLVPDGV